MYRRRRDLHIHRAMLRRPRVFGGLSGYLYHRRLTPLDHCNSNIIRGSRRRRRLSRKPTRRGMVALRDRDLGVGGAAGIGGIRIDPCLVGYGGSPWDSWAEALGHVDLGSAKVLPTPALGGVLVGLAATLAPTQGWRRDRERSCCFKCSADRRLLRF
jgi:hypothetical protein